MSRCLLCLLLHVPRKTLQQRDRDREYIPKKGHKSLLLICTNLLRKGKGEIEMEVPTPPGLLFLFCLSLLFVFFFNRLISSLLTNDLGGPESAHSHLVPVRVPDPARGPEAPFAPAQATGQGVGRPLLVHDGQCQDQVQRVLLGVWREPLPGEVSILHAHIGSTVKNRGFLLFVSACFFSSIIISFSLDIGFGSCCDVIRILGSFLCFSNWNFEGATNSVELEMLNQYCKNLHVINNSLEDGWGEFYDDNHLQQEFKVIFGYQHKWIFEVIILDENLNRVKYDPMNANSDLIDNNAQQCHGLSSLILSTSLLLACQMILNLFPMVFCKLGEIMTAWLPSVFFGDHYPLQFAYVKAPQTSVSQVLFKLT
ncbi:hypothetical protein RHMOL_Rhmol03G0115500 [Rhododendron molle]|uniref:Uncharacterized protein n=1 Tax=Rhododendron molle TaxID=49168 RepID=A0ACC0PFG1_RHOML|nr:hypothetical protein RHMOL_Rhmol03G0115500 [Rhododendron molle]